MSSFVIPFSCFQSFLGSGSFPVSQLRIRWPKDWNFSFSISPSSEYSRLISFMIDRLDLLAVQGTLKSLLQHHSSKASILILNHPPASLSIPLWQIHVYWVSDAIEPSHPLSSPSPPAFNLSQHHGLFRWVSSSHQVAQVLEFQLQHQSSEKIITII